MKVSPDRRPEADWVTRFGAPLVIGVAPLIFLRIGGEFENTPKLGFLQCGISLLALVWLVRMRNRDATLCVRTPLDLPLLLFLVSGLLSLTRAVNVHMAVPSLLHWGAGLILFSYLVHSLRGPTAVPRIFLAAALSCGAISAIGLAQVWLGLDWIPQAAPPAATFGNRNMASHFVAIWFPSIVGLIVISENARTKVTGVACLALSLSYLFHARSLASWLAVIVVMLAATIGLRLLAIDRKRERIPWLPLAVAALVLGVGLFGLWVAADDLDGDDEIVRRLAEFTGTDSGTGALRLIFWKNTLAMARDHPWLGVGPGNFAVQYPAYHRAIAFDWTFDEEHQLERAHNDHLQILAERGLAGFAAWISIFVAALVTAWKLLRDSAYWIRLQTFFVCLGVVSFLIVACFSFPVERAMPPIQLCVLLGMLGFLHGIGCREPAEPLRLPPWVAPALATILVAYLVTCATITKRAIASEVHFAQGLLWTNARQHEKAIASLEQARDATPHDIDVMLTLAENFAETDRCESALAVLREVLRVHPRKVNAMSNMGYCHMKLREYAEAERWISRALDIAPDSPELHTNLGTTYAELGKRDLAIDAYLRAIELAETRPFLPSERNEARRLQPRLLLAKMHVADGQLVDAIAQYEAILDREPNLPAVRRVLAELYLEIGRPEKAALMRRPQE